MLVKVTPKTYRTIFKLLKMMEEKGQEVPDFSLEMELEEAVKFFSKLLQEDSNKEVMFELQQVKEKTKKEVPKKESKAIVLPKQKEKESPSVGRKSVTQDKIIEILKSEGTVTTIQLMEKMQLSRSAVNSACSRLIDRGIIRKSRRATYELVDKPELEIQSQTKECEEDSGELQPSEQSETEELKSSSEDLIKQEQRNFAGVKCKDLFANWKYYEVVDYIFTKTAFTVDNLRKKLATKSNEIVEVIQLALKEGYITGTEQDGRYRVEDIFRLYYFLLKTNRPIPFSKILADFRGNPDVLERLLKKSREKGLVRGRKIHETMCYEAIK